MESNYDSSFSSNKRTNKINKNKIPPVDFFSPVNTNYNIMNLDDKNLLDSIRNSQMKIKYKEDLAPTILNEKKINCNKGQKKTLVLDLDETLVHSSMTPFPYKENIILTIDFHGTKYTIYVIKRPFLETFLNEISNFYDIIIFTASIGQYSDLLLNYIDKNRVVKKVLNRDYCKYFEGFYFKDLSIINREFKDIIIIDNNPISYAFNKENGIPIKSWFDDPNDIELIRLIPFLKFLSKVDDVRPFINLAINQKSGKLDFYYINQFQDNDDKLNNIITKNKSNNINLNNDLALNNVDKPSENKNELNSYMGLIIYNNYLNNNNLMNNRINNINLIEKKNININNNFEKIDIIYNSQRKFNSKTLNQNSYEKTDDKNIKCSNLNKVEKKNIFNKLNEEKITNRNANTLNRNNFIVRKISSIGPYVNTSVEKQTKNNLNFAGKISPIYSKYDSESANYQDKIKENIKYNKNKIKEKKMMIQSDKYNTFQDNNINYISQSRAHLFEQPNAYNHKITVNPKTKPRNTILNNVSNKMKEKESNKPTIYESINKKENLFIEKVKKNSNDKNLKNNEKRKSSFENPQVQNDNYGINITPLRVKTSSDINFSPYTNQIKSKKLFVDKMQTNNNYNTTKSTHKIVVMKIIRNNSKKPYLSSTFNDSKFSSTYNSIKDNKNPSENEQKYHKINLKLNSNDKSKRYLYNRLKKIYKNSLDNNIYNNKML